jgi:hypothetical protein
LLANCQRLKKAIEGICELNHELLRPGAEFEKAARGKHEHTLTAALAWVNAPTGPDSQPLAVLLSRCVAER